MHQFRTSRRNLLKSATAAAGGALAMPLVARHAMAADTIKVGSLLDLSGPIGSSGQAMHATIQLAVDEANAAGGLLGRQVELVNYDTQSTIQLYSQYAQQLALKDKVAVVHGGITSASREAIRPVFDRYSTLYFYNVLYEGGVCDRDCFCTGTTPAQTVNKLVPYAMETWGKKAYIIAADYNYGQITAKWMGKYVRDGGGTVQATEFFPLDVTEFAATISKIQQAGPSVVLSALVGSNHTAFYRQWAAAGDEGQNPDRLDHVRPGERDRHHRAVREQRRCHQLRLLRGADHAGEHRVRQSRARQVRRRPAVYQRTRLRHLRGLQAVGGRGEESRLRRPP